jgi:hypothetical protein
VNQTGESQPGGRKGEEVEEEEKDVERLAGFLGEWLDLLNADVIRRTVGSHPLELNKDRTGEACLVQDGNV